MKKIMTLLSIFGMSTAANADEPVELRTGIILDQSSQTVVAMLPEKGITAIDVTSGETKWSSAIADKPLVIKNGQILSQQQVNKKGLLALVYQSVSNGSVTNTVEVNLPRDVMANVVNTTGTDFKIAMNQASQGNQLEWSFRGKKVRGAAPDVDELINQGVNLSSSEPGIKTGFIGIDFNNAAATTSATNITRNKNSRAIEQRVLPQITGRQFLSQDGKHVLASVRVPSDREMKYNWGIYTRSGELLSSLPADYSYAPFVVTGNLMLFIAPETGRVVDNKLTNNAPMLTAINLQNQQKVWQNAVRSTKYFGQLPQ
ncbi:hypothetical protein OS175_12510 [Marinicella sp. S1101]|uniref:hypothetical protein n=1 Tax=Marinicella marina TaxID=2996016 RepID=UPI002260C756|nr:hypothetical protein [Marinicella marina]MCX7554704.1 hypothetical protein [Marinicella marina]MDJ1141480.1 hypothetical protein [Marinicella marina]